MMRNITAKSRQMQRAKNTALFLTAQGPPFGFYNLVKLIKQGLISVTHSLHETGENGAGVPAVIQHHPEEMLGQGFLIFAFSQNWRVEVSFALFTPLEETLLI
jgi:hypothetical protein